MRVIAKLVFWGLQGPTRPRRVVSFALSIIILLLMSDWFSGSLIAVIAKLSALIIVCDLFQYSSGKTARPSPSMLGVSCIGLAVGALCGHAAAGAYRLGPNTVDNCIVGGAIVGMIVFVVIYALTDFLLADRRHPGRYSTTRMLSERPPLIDSAASCRIDER